MNKLNLQKKILIKRSGYVMNVNNETMRGIHDNLMKNSNSNFNVITGLKDLTLLDIFALINKVKTKDKL